MQWRRGEQRGRGPPAALGELGLEALLEVPRAARDEGRAECLPRRAAQLQERRAARARRRRLLTGRRAARRAGRDLEKIPLLQLRQVRFRHQDLPGAVLSAAAHALRAACWAPS